MSILMDKLKDTKVICQGIKDTKVTGTGNSGRFHTEHMLEYGTKILAGVTPGKGGTQVFDIPVFDSMKEAVEKTECDTSIIYVPAPFAADAIIEAVEANIKLIICITEGIPTIDMLKVKAYLNTQAAQNDRTQLSWNHNAGRIKDWNYAGLHSYTWTGRCCV